MDGEHVQGSPHDLDVRPSYSTLCNPQQFLQKVGQHGSGQGQFNYPISVIVADYNNHRVVMFDQNGSWLLAINGNVSGAQGFKSPWGLDLDPQGDIHVAAHGSNNIKIFTPEGTYMSDHMEM